MATKQEKLLEDYYRRLAGALLDQYTVPQNPQESAEYRQFREMYLLMICSCEAIGDFEFAKKRLTLPTRWWSGCLVKKTHACRPQRASREGLAFRGRSAE